ncbi:MAG: gliding motility-associated C-terminal domain-containing protein [Bacteroidales bacterium]
MFSSAYGTHNRAGEITYKQLSTLTYEITVTTYTYKLSGVFRLSLDVEWGDGTISTVQRRDSISLPDNYIRSTYVATHTYPGPGIFEILVQDPNRNYGVVNIPNSVNTVFSIKTLLFVNPDFGPNNTPILLNYPIDKAGQYRVFNHNPGAYDSDGDSLSYKFTACTGEDGNPITGYSLPPATTSITIDSISGNLIWDSPPYVGKYNIAIMIEEWRNNIKIGYITRDMQIDVFTTNNLPPVNDDAPDICIPVGDTASIILRSTDPNDDQISHTAVGGPFLFSQDPATLTTISSTEGEIISEFSWITNCSHIKKTPHEVLLTAKDNHPDINLVDNDQFTIKVIGPAPTGLRAEPGNGFARISWDTCECNATKYLIYRRDVPSYYTFDSCVTGLTEEDGYLFVGESTDSVFRDDDFGEGLVQGIKYCYRVVSEYADGAQSYPSDEEVCLSLAPGFPIITNVSIEKTDKINGEIIVKWDKPDRLDTIPGATGPYKYLIYRSEDLYGMKFNLIDSIDDLNDTTFFETGLNTSDSAYSYSIALFNDAPGNRFRIGTPQMASAVFLSLTPADNAVLIKINKNTPWLNNQYVIYKYNELTLQYDSIAVTENSSYNDIGLTNGTNVCYKVESIGTYTIGGNSYVTRNWSNESCEIPMDYQHPCQPELNVRSSCDSLFNFLTWNNPNNTCADDVVSYNVYFTKLYNTAFDSIAHIEGAENTFFQHFPDETMGGCYAVSAVDSFGNESNLSYVRCVDECSYYLLPNVFSPNGDNRNDLFVADNPLGYVKKVDMKIFNRWGELVFQTDNPLIEWDGKRKGTNTTVSTGVYYYICDVWEPRVTGLEVRNLVGFIHVYAQETGLIFE